jgi:predicted GIY-YIG superfamily endonuclease
MKPRFAVYRMFTHDHVLLYVGVSKDFGRRWSDHMKTSHWWPLARFQTINWYDTLDLALAAEDAAISAECPVYNITGQEGARWHAVKLSQQLLTRSAALSADPQLPASLRALSRDIAGYLSTADEDDWAGDPVAVAAEADVTGLDRRRIRIRWLLAQQGDRGLPTRQITAMLLADGTRVARETVQRWLAADESAGLVSRTGPPQHRWVWMAKTEGSRA